MNADEPVLAGLPRLERRQRSLLLATVLCYLRGYPLALSVAPAIGWTLVMIGGLFLLSLGFVTIRRIHLDSGGSDEKVPSTPLVPCGISNIVGIPVEITCRSRVQRLQGRVSTPTYVSGFQHVAHRRLLGWTCL